jgi:hypothetical protein
MAERQGVLQCAEGLIHFDIHCDSGATLLVDEPERWRRSRKLPSFKECLAPMGAPVWDRTALRILPAYRALNG